MEIPGPSPGIWSAGDVPGMGLLLENDQVIAINLSFNNLSGKLPEGLNGLVHLTKLNLAFNAIEGELPQSLTDMTQLRRASIIFQ